MNVVKYEARMPELRVSQALRNIVVQMAKEQNIKIADAHRQILVRGLSVPAPVPILQFPVSDTRQKEVA